MTRSVREDIADVEHLLSTHVPSVTYDCEQGLLRHRLLVAQGQGAPAFAEHVPRPGRVRWLGLKGMVTLGLVGALLSLWWGPWRERPAAPARGLSSRPVLVESASAPAPSVQPLQLSPARGSSSQPGRERSPLRQSADSQADVSSAAPVPASEPPGELASVRFGGNVQPDEKRVAPRDAKRPPTKRLRGAVLPTPDDLLEMREVARAEQLLESTPAESLALVRDGQRRFRSGYFDQERRYLEVMALVKLGRQAEARAQAWSLFQDYPRGPYRQRIEAALGSAPP